VECCCGAGCLASVGAAGVVGWKRVELVGMFAICGGRTIYAANPNLDIEHSLVLESNLHNFVRPHDSLEGRTPSDVYWLPVHAKSKFKPVITWFPHIDTNLHIDIQR
jgi:hypothetical protein